MSGAQLVGIEMLDADWGEEEVSLILQKISRGDSPGGILTGRLPPGNLKSYFPDLAELFSLRQLLIFLYGAMKSRKNFWSMRAPIGFPSRLSRRNASRKLQSSFFRLQEFSNGTIYRTQMQDMPSAGFLRVRVQEMRPRKTGGSAGNARPSARRKNQRLRDAVAREAEG